VDSLLSYKQLLNDKNYLRLNKICFVVFFLAFWSSYGQTEETVDSTEVISIAFENTSIKSVLESIEASTNYRFYYLEGWLSNELVSGNYNNERTAKILEDIFKETELNFYMLDKEKIILSKNSIIYDELPKRFFKENISSSEIEDAVTPPQPNHSDIL